MAKKEKNLWWFVMAVAAILLTASCADDDSGFDGYGLKNNYQGEEKDSVRNDTIHTDTIPSDTIPTTVPTDTIVIDGKAWCSVLGTQVKNIDGTIHSIIWGKNNAGDSIKAELVYQLDVRLSAPSRVIGKRDSTIYYMAESEKGYDAWTYVYSGCDSIEQTRISRNFLLRENSAGELYRISLSYNLRRGYILVKGSRYEFPMPDITARYGDHKREWKENFELNDSTFLREVLTSTIKFSAQYVESVLSSTTNIDRQGKAKTKDEPTTPTTDPITADHYVKGLKGYLGGNKFFNKQTNHWSDGLLYEGSDSYLIVVYNYTVNGDGKESFLNRQALTVKKSAIGADSYDAVLCDPNTGEILPGFITVRGSSWTVEGPVSKPDNCYESHTKQEANNSGIKNQPEDNNASCSAVITVNPGETTVAGYKYFTTAVKTSAHNYTVKVADENLKK